ncbi:MAG: hypothetical protein LC775_07805 [Acidobacteria bacterium]|nr:hypothetical protein [Acidobacteriota bacterium]
MYSQNSPPLLKKPNPRVHASQLQVHVVELDAQDEQEVLKFLSHRPIHTVSMVGFIRDNGLVNPLNRGTFYGCRNSDGHLEGVALIGHATLVETTTDRAAEALALVAQTCIDAHMIMGEKERINNFWDYYAEAGQNIRHACRELLFELKWPVEALPEVPGLRLATPADLELVVPVHAQMAFDESGINPLERDPEGFRQRCARRIDSDHRSKGYGLRCMSQLARALLRRTQSVCVLVNANNEKAHVFYQRSGYKLRAIYDTIFLN